MEQPNTYFDLVLSKVRNIMEQRNITIKNQQSILNVMRIAMECVETVQNEKKTGTSKKNIVLKVMLFLINSSDCDDDNKKILKIFIEDGSAETTIDMLVEASKGKLELNKKNKKRLLACFGSCLLNLANSSDQNTGLNEPVPWSKITNEKMV